MSAPAISLAQLRTACGDRALHLRGWMEVPFTFPLAGELWTAATTGHLLVAVRGALEGVAPAPSEHVSSLARVMAQAFPTPEAAPVSVDVAALRAFLGLGGSGAPPLPDCATCQNTGRVECAECDGDGETDCECFECGHDHRRRCSACKGEGSTGCPDCDRVLDRSDTCERVRIAGGYYRRDILATVVAILPDGPALVVPGACNDQRVAALALRAPDDAWRAFVMPTRFAPRTSPNVPWREFPLDAAPAEARP